MPIIHASRLLTETEQRQVSGLVAEHDRCRLAQLTRVEVCILMRERMVAMGRVGRVER